MGLEEGQGVGTDGVVVGLDHCRRQDQGLDVGGEQGLSGTLWSNQVDGVWCVRGPAGGEGERVHGGAGLAGGLWGNTRPEPTRSERRSGAGKDEDRPLRPGHSGLL